MYNTTRKITFLAVLAALGIVLAILIRFPLFAVYLEYDPADIPIYIGCFTFGPLWGLALTLVVALIQGFTVSAKSGLYGILMHILATGSFVIVS